MTGVLNLFMLLNFILMVGLSEMYYNAYFTANSVRLSERSELILKNTKNLFLNNIGTGIYYILLQFIGLITFKVTRYTTLYLSNGLFFYIFLLIAFILVSIVFLYRSPNSNNINLIILILIKLTLIINLLFITTNLIVFILVVELLATLYYFFFLNSLYNQKQTIIKIKNLLINYIWLSLLTLLFCIISFIFIIMGVGTLDFLELTLLSSYLNKSVYLFLFIAMAWKLGLPIFHFFKLELYQFLELDIIFYFSIFSIVINSYLYIYLGVSIPQLYTNINLFLILFIIVTNILLIYRGIDSLKFFQFLAFSGINTLSTIIIFIML